MTTRREMLKGGAGLAAMLAARKAPAFIAKPMLAARQGICIGEKTPQDEYWGLCFTAEEPDVVVNMTKTGNAESIHLETSFDGEIWNQFDSDGGTTPIALQNIGDHVYFRAWISGNDATALDVYRYHSFTHSGKCKASGNVNSLLDGGSKIASLEKPYTFYGLFEGCSNLTSAPDLPATTLNQCCYMYMFNGCTSIISAPDLPATTMKEGCYRGMFEGCTSLVSAPRLPATTLATFCYRNMFYGCVSLNTVEVGFHAWSGRATATWLHNVSQSGVFRCPKALGTDDSITRSASNCPVGWTVVNID